MKGLKDMKEAPSFYGPEYTEKLRLIMVTHREKDRILMRKAKQKIYRERRKERELNAGNNGD